MYDITNLNNKFIHHSLVIHLKGLVKKKMQVSTMLLFINHI